MNLPFAALKHPGQGGAFVGGQSGQQEGQRFENGRRRDFRRGRVTLV